MAVEGSAQSKDSLPGIVVRGMERGALLALRTLPVWLSGTWGE